MSRTSKRLKVSYMDGMGSSPSKNFGHQRLGRAFLVGNTLCVLLHVMARRGQHCPWLHRKGATKRSAFGPSQDADLCCFPLINGGWYWEPQNFVSEVRVGVLWRMFPLNIQLHKSTILCDHGLGQLMVFSLNIIFLCLGPLSQPKISTVNFLPTVTRQNWMIMVVVGE